MSRITAMFSLFLMIAVMALCGPCTADAGPFGRSGRVFIAPAPTTVVAVSGGCANGQCNVSRPALATVSSYTIQNSVTVGGPMVRVGTATVFTSNGGNSCPTCQPVQLRR